MCACLCVRVCDEHFCRTSGDADWQEHYVQWDAANGGLCVYKAEEQALSAKLFYVGAWATESVSVAEFDPRLIVKTVAGQVRCRNSYTLAYTQFAHTYTYECAYV
jgi:hypothetical protein